ncbi:MAG: YhjD/YihY/BrkB family envelope integrity protein [Corynebacterium sp.]|uniref:YhjD/YihY/BrkB family envelope integrity protein n=1 Tax=Corynebacterium sp. TaxID=1720 RepID=UPI0026DCE8C4|nr:YhjD/YihY/BrkB family envelope integrity protein [Corynebacterium sp.]MDO5097703.1 YhjD/YihY/BrkB family envelope integrity protein [Corynebacterium sp.]
MATTTQQNDKFTDEYGIERNNRDEPGFIDTYRDKWQWFDHLMLMNERYTQRGGNQFAAGITYFSVLSMFPLLMLTFAAVATVLASRPDLVHDITDRLTSIFDGSLGDTVDNIISTAIDQRGAMYGVGGVTALWSGLNWMNNLRYGVSYMWNYPIDEGNFFKTKLADLLGLLTTVVLMIIAIGLTVVGNSGLTTSILAYVGLDDVPGIFLLTRVLSLVFGLIANFMIFYWMLKKLPRGEVPVKSALAGSAIGAVVFEIFKQLGSAFFSSALTNPAGATFGPIIGVMVLFYFIWRILLYCSAWSATTQESLAIAKLEAPAPAVIHVRQEIAAPPATPQRFGTGLAVGAAAVGALTFLGLGGKKRRK